MKVIGRSDEMSKFITIVCIVFPSIPVVLILGYGHQLYFINVRVTIIPSPADLRLAEARLMNDPACTCTSSSTGTLPAVSAGG